MTRLSPYITHGFASLPEVPDDIRRARTGIPVIDQAVRTLYATGYLHNHARLWLASYVVHLRKAHWRAGADWMIAHLLDGDLASNHLSWQWVAGTGSHKPYLFNASNVARYAPPGWHSAGTAIDASYEALTAMACDPQPVRAMPQGEGVDEPSTNFRPPFGSAPSATDVVGRDVWLVHPWALGEPPSDLPAGCLKLGWWPSGFHAAWPWSAARWEFVGVRMSALTSLQWHGSSQQLLPALAAARSVQTQADLHIGPLLPALVKQRPQARLFAQVDRCCASFSSWWAQSTAAKRRTISPAGIIESMPPTDMPACQ